MELKQRFAILNDKKKLIKTLYPEITNESGIYCFYRTDKDGVDCCYIGQAKNLLNRIAQHLMGKQQHIDKSLYVHKLYDEDNKNGWKITILERCGLDELDYLEQRYIKFYSNIENVKVYNVTGGGQFDKKADINQRQQRKLKSYKNGKNLGYEKARDYIKVMFDKYLDYSIKGKISKTKERKLVEFKEWLEVQNGEVEEN